MATSAFSADHEASEPRIAYGEYTMPNIDALTQAFLVHPLEELEAKLILLKQQADMVIR